MKTLALALALAMTAASAAQTTVHILETTHADSERQQTNWFVPAGHVVTFQTHVQNGGAGNLLRFTSHTTGSQFDILPGMPVVIGPGLLHARSYREGTSFPRQLVIFTLAPLATPREAVVQVSRDLTNWTEAARVWLPVDAREPGTFYRLTVDPAR